MKLVCFTEQVVVLFIGGQVKEYCKFTCLMGFFLYVKKKCL